MTVNGDLLELYKEFVTDAMVAFLPLLASVIGIFVAFSIMHQLIFLVKRSVKKG